MYQMYISHHPAPGKGQELRVAMEERSKAAAAQGTPIALATQLWGPDANFVHVRRHESLQDIEDYTQKNQADPAYVAAIAKITACLDRPQTGELDRVLVPVQAAGPVNYALRVRYVPAVGQGPALSQALVARASVAMKGAIGVGLGSQAFPVTGANFSATILFSSLVGVEQFRDSVQSDPTFRVFQDQIRGLLGALPTQAFYRVLISFPGP